MHIATVLKANLPCSGTSEERTLGTDLFVLYFEVTYPVKNELLIWERGPDQCPPLGGSFSEGPLSEVPLHLIKGLTVNSWRTWCIKQQLLYGRVMWHLVFVHQHSDHNWIHSNACNATSTIFKGCCKAWALIIMWSTCIEFLYYCRSVALLQSVPFVHAR